MTDPEKPKHPIAFLIIDVGVAILGLWAMIWLKSIFIHLPPTGY